MILFSTDGEEDIYTSDNCFCKIEVMVHDQYIDFPLLLFSFPVVHVLCRKNFPCSWTCACCDNLGIPWTLVLIDILLFLQKYWSFRVKCTWMHPCQCCPSTTGDRSCCFCTADPSVYMNASMSVQSDTSDRYPAVLPLLTLGHVGLLLCVGCSFAEN